MCCGSWGDRTPGRAPTQWRPRSKATHLAPRPYPPHHNTHAHTHTNTHTRPYIHIHTHTRAHVRTHLSTCWHTHTHYIQTHTYTHSRYIPGSVDDGSVAAPTISNQASRVLVSEGCRADGVVLALLVIAVVDAMVVVAVLWSCSPRQITVAGAHTPGPRVGMSQHPSRRPHAHAHTLKLLLLASIVALEVE